MFRFERFDDMDGIEFFRNLNIRQLSRWSTGEEQAPYILVIGYAEWMLLLITFRGDLLFNVLDSLDTIWTVDNAVIRMLLNMREGTHVLVMAQSRTKPRSASHHTAIYFQAHSDANVEWTESIFLSNLARLTHALKTQSSVKQKDIYDSFYGSDDHANAAKYLYHLRMQSTIGKGIFDPSNTIRRESSFYGPLGSLLELINKKDSRLKKELSSIASGSASLWFWDTPLPFIMAAINDCEKLFQHDPITIKYLPLVLRFDIKRLYFIAASGKINSYQSMHFSKFSSDDELPYAKEDFTRQNNASTNQFIESFYFLHSRQLFNENLTKSTSEILKTTLGTADDYFDRFAAAYSLPVLHCLDIHHAGTSIERLEVTQIFNLICNKHLKLTNDYCCT